MKKLTESLMKAIELAEASKVFVAGPKFASAASIMETDKDKYWVQNKRDPNGNTFPFCSICMKYMTLSTLAPRPSPRTGFDVNTLANTSHSKSWKNGSRKRHKE